MYVKPTVCVDRDMHEGIYLSSGNKSGCKSKYMDGIFVLGTYQPIKDGYKKGRGCEGCPASNGSSCRFVTKPEEMNWDGDFRPSWEVQDHKPDELGY